jgi:uncharacterized protein YndB with AHSA1/START domain
MIMNKSEFVYVVYIRTTPERLWSALTGPDFMKQYWFGMHFQTDWKSGSTWQLVFPDGRVADTGEIVEIDPPRRMVLKWRNDFRPELKAEGYARCTIELAPIADSVKLSITHVMDRAQSQFIEAVSGGWPRILFNLKSLLETGEISLKRQRPADKKASRMVFGEAPPVTGARDRMKHRGWTVYTTPELAKSGEWRA